MCVCVCVGYSPGTVSGVISELPSGGALSPTTLGSWAWGGGGYTGLGEGSWRSFFGTRERKDGVGRRKGMREKEKGC